MRVLLSTNLSKYQFIDPDDNYLYGLKYHSYQDLTTHIKDRRDVLGFKQDVSFLIDAYLANLPENETQSRDIVDSDKVPSNIINGVKALLTQGCIKNCVGIDLATKRASVCARCKFNTLAPTDNNLIQSIGVKLFKMIMPKSETIFDKFLGTCLKCSCDLKLKVHCDKMVVESSLDPSIRQKLPKNDKVDKTNPNGVITCWQIDSELL